MSKQGSAIIAVAIAAVGLGWWLSRPAPDAPAGAAAGDAPLPATTTAAADPKPSREAEARQPPQVDFPMEIPRDLPPLRLPAGASVVVLEEIEDVPTRRHVYGRAATGAIGCIGAAGIDLKRLNPEFRARIVIAPTGDGGSQVQDIVMLHDDDAPPELVKCLRKALGETQLELRGVRGVVTTPPFAGERPAKAPAPATP